MFVESEAIVMSPFKEKVALQVDKTPFEKFKRCKIFE